MDNININSAIIILSTQWDQSEPSYELIKAISNFSRTSKLFNEAISTQILLDISSKSAEGRSKFSQAKISVYIKSDDYNGFYNFVGDLIKIYHHLDYLPILTELLSNIVSRCSYDFLKIYMHILDTQVWCDLQRKRHLLKYPSYFEPIALVDALKSAYKLEKYDSALLLMNILATYATGRFLVGTSFIDEIRSAIKNKERLDFDTNVGKLIEEYFSRGIMPPATVLNHLLPRPEKLPITPELFELPIELQPWFFGCYSKAQIWLLLEEPSCVMVFYYEEKLYVAELEEGNTKCVKSVNFKITEDPAKDVQSLKDAFGDAKYYLSNKGYIRKPEVFKFYSCLLQEDFEGMKWIHKETPIDWDYLDSNCLRYKTTYLNFECPYSVYLSSNNPRVDCMQLLYDLGAPLHRWLSIDNLTLTEDRLSCIQFLLEKGVKLDISRVSQLLKERACLNLDWFKRILNGHQRYYYYGDEAISVLKLLLSDDCCALSKKQNFLGKKIISIIG